MLYNPSKVAVAGVLVWASVWLIMPLEVTGYLSWGATFYIVGCYLALFAGVAMARPLNVENRPTVQWQIPYDPRLFWGTLTIGLLGLGLRLLDRVVFRGVEYGATALVLRETLEVSSVSFAGAVGAVLYVMCMIPLVVLLTSRADRQRVWLYLLATVTFVLPVLESLAQLSRSFMLVAIGFGFGAVIIARFGGNPFNRRIAGAAVTAILVIGVASTLIFSARLELSERRLDDSIFESVYAENLQPNINANVALSGGGRAGEEVFYRTILPNGKYYLSGMYEFTT